MSTFLHRMMPAWRHAAILLLVALALLPFAGGSARAQAVVPQNGYWVSPGETGRSYAVEIKNGRLFFAIMYYDTDHTSKWAISNGPMVTPLTYTGPMLVYRNGQVLHSGFKPPAGYEQVGTLNLTFTSATTATLVWPGGTTALVRNNIIPGGVAAGRAANMPETGWYWQPTEAGRGWFFESQGNTVLLTGVMYEAGGPTEWIATTGPMVSPYFYMGSFASYSGGAALGEAYHAPTQMNDMGYVTMLYSLNAGDTSSTLWLGTGVTTQLVRFNFSPSPDADVIASNE